MVSLCSRLNRSLQASTAIIHDWFSVFNICDPSGKEKRNMQDNSFQTIRMPMIALRGLVVFPGMLLTFDVERPASVAALAEAGRSARCAVCASSCGSRTAASAA